MLFKLEPFSLLGTFEKDLVYIEHLLQGQTDSNPHITLTPALWVIHRDISHESLNCEMAWVSLYSWSKVAKRLYPAFTGHIRTFDSILTFTTSTTQQDTT